MSTADPLRTAGLARLEKPDVLDSTQALVAVFVRYNAARDLTLYERTAEEHLVWRVYQAHRNVGLAIPDRVLAIFDDWAARPASPTAARAIRAASANLDVVQHLSILERDFGLRPNAATRAVSVVIDSTVNVTIAQASILPSSAVFPADAMGNVSSFTGGVATITVTEMPSGTDVTALWSYSETPSTGVTAALSGTHNNVLTVSAMSNSNDTGYVDVTATRTGFPTLTQRFVLSKAKSATLPSTLNQSIGTISATASTTPQTVQANAAVKLNSSGYVAKRQGNSSSTFSDTSTKFETAGSFTASYYAQYNLLSQTGTGTLSGLGQLSLVNASNAGNAATLSVTNGSATALLACVIYDSTGANQLANRRDGCSDGVHDFTPPPARLQPRCDADHAT